MTQPEVIARISRWEWDRAQDSVQKVLGRARAITWVSGGLLTLLLVGAGWVLMTGVLRESAVIYGALLGIVGGYLVRGAYVATAVRRAVAPVKAAIVPAVVRRASEAQLASMLVHGGSMFDPHLLLRAVPGDAVVEITSEDLALGDQPRPGFLQLLFTGPDGTYYDDGSGTMARPTDFTPGDIGGGDGGGT